LRVRVIPHPKAPHRLRYTATAAYSFFLGRERSQTQSWDATRSSSAASSRLSPTRSYLCAPARCQAASIGRIDGQSCSRSAHGQVCHQEQAPCTLQTQAPVLTKCFARLQHGGHSVKSLEWRAIERRQKSSPRSGLTISNTRLRSIAVIFTARSAQRSSGSYKLLGQERGRQCLPPSISLWIASSRPWATKARPSQAAGALPATVVGTRPRLVMSPRVFLSLNRRSTRLACTCRPAKLDAILRAGRQQGQSPG